MDTGDIQVLPQQLSSPSIVADTIDIEAMNNSLVTSFTERPSNQNASFQSYKDLFAPYFQAIMSGQVHQATGIKDVMDLHFQHLQVEMNKNKALQEPTVLMQSQVILMQQQMDAKQGQILQLQTQSMDRMC